MSDLEKKYDSLSAEVKEISLGITNGDIPKDYYSFEPCLIGYSYIRFQVDGDIRPCCISKYEIGSHSDYDWREIWHSGAYENFRKKMKRISTDKFHLSDPDWSFCQQCSHLTHNQNSVSILKK